MTLNCRATINLSLLDSAQLDKIHQASLEVLATVGVVVRDQDAISLLGKAGATVEKDRVKIPAQLVDAAIGSAPSGISIFDRQGNLSMRLEGKNTYFGSGSDCPRTIDPETNEHRDSCKADVARIAKLIDGLENYDFCMSMGIASDASELTSYVHQFDAMIRNTSKPLIFTADNAADMEDILDLAAVVIDGGREELKARPRYILYNEPISPLLHSSNGLGKLLFAARNNVPMIYIASPMMGGSAPVTMAGCIVQANAETLSGLVIHQLMTPGAPFIYGADASILDMQTMVFSYGCPELQLIDMAFADLARRYELPLFCIGGATDSKVVDAQAGAEAGISLLISALNGCNLIHDVGYLESGLCSSTASIVMANELIGMTKRYLAAFEINDETLALDVIERVGPQGEFLTDDHTMKNYRRDVWQPTLLDRRVYESWNEAGGRPIVDAAQCKGLDILTNHQPEILSEEQHQVMDGILARRG